MPDKRETEQQGLAQPKKYEVTGPRGYLGHPPGSVFSATIPEEQERRAVDSGALTVKPANTTEREGDAEPTTASQAQDRAEQERAAIEEAVAADKARSE